MQKDRSYHESAVKYNDELARFAAELADELEHPEVQRWSRAVAKQHRFHSGRHKKALVKIDEQSASAQAAAKNAAIVVTTYDGQDLNDFNEATAAQAGVETPEEQFAKAKAEAEAAAEKNGVNA